MDILKALEREFSIKAWQVENTVKMIDEGNTIPFIARYRKEKTGSLTDETLRKFYDRLNYMRNLDEKKQQVLQSIDEQGKLTDQLKQAIEDAGTMVEVDDIYRPYRPKRRTRATIAKEKGLEPLAVLMMLQRNLAEFRQEAAGYVDEEKDVPDVEAAIQGAMDIVAEQIADEADYRTRIRELTVKKGSITVKAKDAEAESVYEIYYDFSEPVGKIQGYKVLAINRGEKEKLLGVKIESPVEEITRYLHRKIIKTNDAAFFELMKTVIDDAYNRLIAPSIEREVRNLLTEKAEEGAIEVFGKNLVQLLMQPPISGHRVLALDPGFRTGCKVAAIDATGKVLDTGVIYPTPPKSKIAESEKTLMGMIKKFDIDVIAIGNGTASRETESFVSEMLKKVDKAVAYIIVNEAGASVYSASKLGTEEFPEYDVALRSAVSIGRRLQDPLAELVKIDPKSIGVGQYQHDMNQKRLDETLAGVVEDCVNSVGVDLNTASPSLLSYIAGISGTISKNIVAYREENGRFKSRRELLKVAKLGPKAYEQCAGFLRIPGGVEPLDNTGIHPESYSYAEEVSKRMNQKEGYKIDFGELAAKLEVGLPTLKDIVKELEKPGRDPRDDMPKPILRNDILEMKDLEEGMVLKGTVRNVIDFGAFVDIGVHQDGLVHISQLADRYVKHPLEVVSVGDVVDVKVLSVDEKKKRISLTMRM